MNGGGAQTQQTSKGSHAVTISLRDDASCVGVASADAARSPVALSTGNIPYELMSTGLGKTCSGPRFLEYGIHCHALRAQDA